MVLEREAELRAIEQVLDVACVGDGVAVLVEGPAGIGKTALLRAAAALAGEREMRVLSARGGELERSFPYGVARQLFESLVATAEPDDRRALLSGAAAHAAAVVDPRANAKESPARDRQVIFHGLYWLTANLASERPLVLLVDDLHWGDPASVEWLLYLARRTAGMPLAVVLGTRTSEPGAEHGLVDRLRADGVAYRLEPAPLSEDSVDALARGRLGAGVERGFVSACRAATGGNPFYITELLRTLHEDGVAGAAADAVAIEGASPRAVTQATLARLGRMPATTRAVAAAVAVLEPNAHLRHVAELAGVDSDAAAGAADSLRAIAMLDSVNPCRFAHPILRSAVEDSIDAARRQREHMRAARLLEAAGAEVSVVAAHLLTTSPAGDALTVDVLRRAAVQGMARGAATEAAGYLRRALSEPPPDADRSAVMLELGVAENGVQPGAGLDHLREALARAGTPAEIATAALALGQALAIGGELNAAYEVARAASDRLAGHRDPLTRALESFMILSSGPAGRDSETDVRRRALEAEISPDSPGACALLGDLALRELQEAAPRSEVVRLAERALVEGELCFSQAEYFASVTPALALMMADELERAESLFTRAIERARGMGSVRSFTHFTGFRGWTFQKRGDLARAEADLEQVLDIEACGATSFGRILATIPTVLMLVDRGEPDAALRLAEQTEVSPESEDHLMVKILRHAQAVALLALRRFDEASAGFAQLLDRFDRRPAPWGLSLRAELALALAGAGRRDEALATAREELGFAELGGIDRARGAALRALGLIEGGEPGLRLLESSVAAYERSSARLEHARALCDHGAALRRARQRRAARDPLRRALEMALVCGGTAVAERAAEELAATGARPRSIELSGAALLTASERRVCLLAVDGLSNREIAQALFVTRKTVETHLGHAYQKLDLSGRHELADALAAPAAAGSGSSL